jgi:hypothetical protein
MHQLEQSIEAAIGKGRSGGALRLSPSQLANAPFLNLQIDEATAQAGQLIKEAQS